MAPTSKTHRRKISHRCPLRATDNYLRKAFNPQSNIIKGRPNKHRRKLTSNNMRCLQSFLRRSPRQSRFILWISHRWFPSSDKCQCPRYRRRIMGHRMKVRKFCAISHRQHLRGNAAIKKTTRTITRGFNSCKHMPQGVGVLYLSNSLLMVIMHNCNQDHRHTMCRLSARLLISATLSKRGRYISLRLQHITITAYQINHHHQSRNALRPVKPCPLRGNTVRQALSASLECPRQRPDPKDRS